MVTICVLLYSTVGTPVGALTGRTDKHTQATIKSLLCIISDAALSMLVQTDQILRFSVTKTKKLNQLQQLIWLIKMLKENGKDTPKTIMMVDIATILNYLMLCINQS
jgi:hypothetical protein